MGGVECMYATIQNFEYGVLCSELKDGVFWNYKMHICLEVFIVSSVVFQLKNTLFCCSRQCISPLVKHLV